jgi:small multidrug resistance family-3 protein
MVYPLKTFGLFFVTAVAEIGGCYLVYMWLRLGKSVTLLLPAGIVLAIFAVLLTLHPMPAGRTYAAYGGVYVASAMCWLWFIEGIKPDLWDITGASVAVLGMLIIAFAPHGS